MNLKKPIQNRHASEVDFRTPQFIFDGAMDLFDVFFTLDVAASQENRLCSWYFDAEMDALQQRWWGHVWCNPPYNNIGPWAEKAIRSVEAADALSVTLLLPASTCTKWFEKLWAAASDIVFISGRLKFEGPHRHPDTKKANATNPSVLLHIDREGFRRAPNVRMVNARGGNLS